MKYPFYTIVVFGIIFSCRENDRQSLENKVILVDSINIFQRYIGLKINDKREGIYNSYNKDNELSETIFFSQDTLRKKWIYYSGFVAVEEIYENGIRKYSVVKNYETFLNHFNLNQVRYKFGGPKFNDGRVIFNSICINCHLVSEEKKYNSTKDNKIQNLLRGSKLDSINNQILLYPSDTARHYSFGFLSENDKIALRMFLSRVDISNR